MSTTQPTPARRRRGQQTAQSIMVAATDLFLSRGYAETSLDQVASAAGVTKPTVYSHFESKQALLREVTRQNASERVALVTAELKPTHDPREDLYRFSKVIAETVLSERSRAWHRLAGLEALNHPEVGEAIYAAGPARVIQLLTDYLATQKRRGLLLVRNPERAAEQLLGMLIGVEFLRGRSGQAPKSPAQLRRFCRDSVDVFLDHFGKDRS